MMPSIRQISAWKEGAQRLKAYRFKRRNRSVVERVDDVEKAIMGMFVLVMLLSGIVVYLLMTK